MKPIIEVKNLSKRYCISHQNGGSYNYNTLREDLVNLIKKPINWISSQKKNKEYIFALNDINLSVEQGEILGIIGPNGAGKSTLLKILTRITPPTHGEAVVRGRICSLLEVGTGFHPELTGRENIYLNGAILGMRKKEIDRKFNEIVEFSGVEKFLDTPLKRYSSGMNVRLAFSVAVNLEPEILLIDEVLAVGDAAFQKKSLGKMEEVTQKSGRTILFVSHNMGAIQGLCKRTILLDKGKIVKIGPTQEVINFYLNSDNISPVERVFNDAKQAPGDEFIRLHSVKVHNSQGKVTENIDINEPVDIEIEYWNLKQGPQRIAGVHFWNDEGIKLFVSHDLNNREWRDKILPVSLIKSVCKVPSNIFSEGRIFATVEIDTFDGVAIDHVIAQNIVSFKVFDSDQGDSVKANLSHWGGVVRPVLKWNSEIKNEKI